MKRLLLIITLLLAFTLMGCCEKDENGYCNLHELRTTTTEVSATTQAAIDELRDEQQLIADMLYDILIVKYSTENCTYDELQDYAYEYEQIKDADLGPFYEETLYEIDCLINMIDDQIKERNIAERENADIDYYLLMVISRRTSGTGYEYIFREVNQQTPEDWSYCDKLFSVGEFVLAIETGQMKDGTHDEEVLFYDFS